MMNTTETTKQSRLLSIDALRGFDMMFIMGFTWFISTLCKLSDGPVATWIASQLTHAKWDGFTQHDTIFPLFLFISGMTFPFSLAAQKRKGLSGGKIYGKILYRSLMLVLLGFVYGGVFRFNFASQRWLSVLGRIGLAWGIAAVLFINCKTKLRTVIAALTLVAYGLVSYFVAAPDVPAGASPLSLEGCFAGWVDRLLVPGKLYLNTFDPEGLFSLIPAVVTAMLGQFTGEFVQNSNKPGSKNTLCLLGGGVVLLALGLIVNIWIPVNKNLWSTSFVLVVGAYSVILYAVFYWLIEVRGWRKWSKFFEIIGLNSITIYLAQRIIPFGKISDFFVSGFATQVLPEQWQPVLLSGAYFFVSWLFLWFLYKKKVFLKV